MIGGSAPSSGATDLPDPYKVRRWVGYSLWTLGQLIGGGLFLLLFIIAPLFEANPSGAYFRMGIGAVLALPAMLAYLTFPRLLDRYDPEPLYALLLALLWGALAACGFSALINSLVGGLAANLLGPEAGDAIGAILSAPFVEEFWKGLMVVGIAYFLRQEFDGVVDGIIYATFTAIGFAATENVIYYGRALEVNFDSLAATFFLRGVLAPWGHPLYTSMTGIGVGIARESTKTWVKVVAPILGYLGAVLLHMLWNGLATLCDYVGGESLFFLLLPLWIIFVVAFVILVIALVVRRGRTLRAFLLDEIALGYLTRAEVDLVCSAFGGLVAFFKKGTKGTAFVRAVARLALSKWHTSRAAGDSKSTVSMDFIVPLRAKIRDLKAAGASPV